MALNATAASIPALIAQRVAAHGGATILRKKDRGIWRSFTWSELGDGMRGASLALRAGGFGHGEVAAVLADTRPEWVIADLGILAAGGVSAGIPPDCTAARLGTLLRETSCRVLFVENEEQFDKALEVRGDCPALRRIVIFDMKGLRDFADADCEDFAGLLARGAQSPAATWQADVAAIAADDRAVLLIPTDPAESVQHLTHGAVLRAVAEARAVLQPRPGDERVALLPLSDRLERIHGLYCGLDAGAVSNFLEQPDTALENLQEVQPTLLGTDAALWRMLQARIESAVAGATPVQRWLYRRGIGAARRGGTAATLARGLVLHQVRRELGLARLRLAWLDAPPPPETAAWIAALGITLRQIATAPAPPAVSDPAVGAMALEA